MDHPEKDRYISVDVETSGPNPGTYSLLSIGACTLFPPRREFYIELKPTSVNAIPEALEVSQLTLADLEERGEEPMEAMRRFADRLGEQIRLHEVGTGTGDQKTAVTDEFHAAEIDLTVAFYGIFGCLSGFGEGRGIENDNVVIFPFFFQRRQ